MNTMQWIWLKVLPSIRIESTQRIDCEFHLFAREKKSNIDQMFLKTETSFNVIQFFINRKVIIKFFTTQSFLSTCAT